MNGTKEISQLNKFSKYIILKNVKNVEKKKIKLIPKTGLFIQ